MMVAGTSVEGIDSIKDMFEAVLKRESVQTQKADLLGSQLISSLQAYVATNHWIQQDASEAIEWAQLDEAQKPVPTSQMVEETKDLGGSVGGMAFAYGPVFDDIHVEMYRKAMQEHERELETSELLEKLDMKGNTLSWDPKNPTNPDYLIPRPPKPALTEDERIIEEFDKAIDEMTDEEKELLFNNREYMNPLKFCDWFIQNRPNSIYVNSFRKVTSHLKKMDTMSWRTPLDRDPVISRRVKLQYRLMRTAKRSGLLGRKDFYVIYALMQKRDLFTGVKLAKPIFEVGYATSPRSMRSITGRHSISLLESLKRTSNVYFRIAYFKSLKAEGAIPKNARFSDYFESVPIDMAATKKQRDNLEIFYTIYVNRINGRMYYNLEKNLKFNAIIGRKYDDRRIRAIVEGISNVPIEVDEAKYYIYISKENLDSAIRFGLEKADLQWYFRESSGVINKILDYYYPSRNWKDIRREVLTDYLIQLAKSGVQSHDLKNYFYRTKQSAHEVMKNWKDRSFQVEIIPYSRKTVESLLGRTLGSFGEYNSILFELYLKPQLIAMVADGLITKEKLIDVIKGASQLPYLDPSTGGRPSGNAFRWLFQLLFAPDIFTALSNKDYSHVSPELVRDLGLAIEGDLLFNRLMVRRLDFIIEAMFGTTSLSEIYRILNSGAL